MGGAITYFMLLSVIVLLFAIVLVLLVRKNGFILSITLAGTLCTGLVARTAGPTITGKLALATDWISGNLAVSIGEPGYPFWLITVAAFYLLGLAMHLFAKHENLKLSGGSG